MNSGDVLAAFTNNALNMQYVWLGVKILFLIGIAIYCVFTLSVLRQAQLMNNVLKIRIKPSFKSIALIFFLASAAYFLLALLIL